MKIIKFTAGLALIAAVSACSSANPVNRYSPLDTNVTASAPVAVQRNYNVVDVRVNVPTSLSVSEANSYLPRADIVWRGDPWGNRYEQIEAIFEAGMTRGVSSIEGDRSVIVDIQVSKFHSLTEKTRYSFGGVHNIKFTMTILDAQTGAVLEEPRSISANLDGFGGQQAIVAEQMGQTQKVRITDHLARVIYTELTTPV
ncbi:MAG: DUF6778 family protein [Pseudoruegeria sp.]